MKRNKLLAIVILTLLLMIVSFTNADQYQLETLADFTVPNTNVRLTINSIEQPNDETSVTYSGGGTSLIFGYEGENMCIFLSTDSLVEMQDAIQSNALISGIFSKYQEAIWYLPYLDTDFNFHLEKLSSWEECLLFDSSLG